MVMIQGTISPDSQTGEEGMRASDLGPSENQARDDSQRRFLAQQCFAKRWRRFSGRFSAQFSRFEFLNQFQKLATCCPNKLLHWKFSARYVFNATLLRWKSFRVSRVTSPLHASALKGISWCCKNHCWLVTVLLFAYCLLPFQSVFATSTTPRNCQVYMKVAFAKNLRFSLATSWIVSHINVILFVSRENLRWLPTV